MMRKKGCMQFKGPFVKWFGWDSKLTVLECLLHVVESPRLVLDNNCRKTCFYIGL